MIKEFYSNGKLLLTGEYAVLDGALALAIPTKYGQYLRIAKANTNTISWRSIDEKGLIWFEANYKLDTITEITSSDKQVSNTLQDILRSAKQLNPKFLSHASGYTITTELTFPRNWGLGTSSTLINNLANWANINPQQLLNKTFGGSGYDIACAQYNHPILYKVSEESNIVKETKIDFSFSKQLYFIFLNKKKNSREAIAAYKERKQDKAILVNEITQITNKVIVCDNLQGFEDLINQHEQILAKALGIAPIKAALFSDYFGAIKSLGGWGGDFILATGNSNTPSYFHNNGYPIVIPYHEMKL